MNATQALASGREGNPQRDTTAPAQATEPVEPWRKRRRISLTDVLFKLLCLVITGFFVLVAGGFGVFLYLLG
jgi:hypothetical protein